MFWLIFLKKEELLKITIFCIEKSVGVVLMKKRYVLNACFVFVLSFACVYFGFVITNYWQQTSLFCDNHANFNIKQPATISHYNRKKITNNYMPLEIVIKDDIGIDKKGAVLSVFFDRSKLNIYPANCLGERGIIKLLTKPGVHNISWKVHKYFYHKKIDLKQENKINNVQIIGKKIFID